MLPWEWSVRVIIADIMSAWWMQPAPQRRKRGCRTGRRCAVKPVVETCFFPLVNIQRMFCSPYEERNFARVCAKMPRGNIVPGRSPLEAALSSEADILESRSMLLRIENIFN